jgi:O-antigen/teichoic acid export membrane protein
LKTIQSPSRFSNIKQILSDESLTKKATLNALASVLDYSARLIVAFFLSPIMVNVLGDYFFGVWKILSSSVSFISPTSGRPSTVLRYALAHHQSSQDIERKRVFISSAMVSWAIFLPLVGVIGSVFAWFIPQWIDTPSQFEWPIRLTAAILVGDLALTGLSAIPQAVLGGQNLGYKRMGLTVILVFLGGGLTWLGLSMGYGIVGVAAATITSTFLSGLLSLYIVKIYTPWVGVSRPDRNDIREYLGLSWWFIAWDIVYKVMMASDVIILGVLHSVAAVTGYTLTKYVPEILISIIDMVVFGIAPGLGGIIGASDFKKAASIRGELMAMAWLITTTLGGTIMLWNRLFLNLWVGANQYAGAVTCFLICVLVAQFILIRIDGNFIDLTLKIKQKVILGALAVGLSITISVILVIQFKMGVVGVLIGMIAGRSTMSFGYPAIIGRILNVTLSEQLRKLTRPVVTTTVVYISAYMLDSLRWIGTSNDVLGWIKFVVLAGVTATVLVIIAFFGGLTRVQREKIWKRFRSMLPATTR